MTTPKWRFRPHTKEERAADDFAGEFFRTTHNTGLAESLVRESIQNSLDAGDDLTSEPIKVRFAFSDVEFVAIEPFVGGLWPRLESPDLRTLDAPNPGGTVRVLCIEDFGTVGLEGDPARHDDPEGRLKDRYWEFWRNLGRGNRGVAQRGRWGLGKSVFHIASEIGTYFGFTVRRGDDRELLMGLSQLKVHYFEGQRFDSYGYFGLQDEANFTHPVELEADVVRFKDTFGLKRNGNAGLSLAIPYVHEDISAGAIAEAVVRGYFFPLLNGELVVEIDDGGEIFKIDSDYVNSAESISGLSPSVIEMARFAIDDPDKIEGLVNDPPRNASVRWAELEFSDEKLSNLATRLTDTGFAEVSVNIFVHPSETASVLTKFRVILKREPDQAVRSVMFIRNGITITDVKHNSLRGYSAMVITDEAPLSEFLGDSETPAHTSWKANRARFGKKYKFWNPTIEFVSESASSIVERLLDSDSELDSNIFSDIFFVELGEPESRVPKKPTRKKTSTGIVDPPSPPTSTSSRFRTETVDGGFEVTGSEDCPDGAFRLRIKMAYANKQSRSSTKSYHPFDFDLGSSSMQVITHSATLVECDGNIIVVDVDARDFSVRAIGFDNNRDLFVAPPRVIPGD